MEQVEGLDTSTYVGKAALAVKTKVRGIMGDNLIVFTLLDFVSFMNLNNKFASLGIFITNDNREVSYIKIIELGDPVLIDDLETYINLKDSLALIEDKKKEYYDIINLLKDSTSDDEVNSIIKEYLKR